MFRPLLPLIRRLHFYAGILIAPFVLIAAISGGLYALAPTAEQIVYRHLLHTDSAGPPQTIAAQLASVRDRHPGAVVTGVEPAAGGSETTRVYLADDRVGEWERRTVFVDPQTTEVLGDSVTYGSAGALPMRTWIGGLHRNLHLGEPGRVYSELAASWLWVVALGGLVLWINRFRTKRRNTGASWWRIGTIDRQGTSRNRTLSRHGAVGVWLVVGLVFLSATGLTWSHYAGDNIAKLRTELSWQRPDLPTVLPTGSHHGTHGPEAPPAGIPTLTDDQFDEVLAISRRHGLDGRVEIAVPADPGSAVTVTQTRQPWRYSVDSLAIDPHTMQVTAALPFSSWSIPAKLTDWAIQLHMGILFGWVSALALLTLAVLLVVVIVHGYLLWWRRGPASHPGRAPDRGTWRTAARTSSPASRVVFAALVGTTIIVGWFVPLLGIPLLAFLIVDALIGRRSPTDQPHNRYRPRQPLPAQR
jgi:uncharacterized iron-regulated membrane protein